MARRRERGITQPDEPARMPAAGRVCGQQHGPAWCPRPVFSRGLCRPHYRRAAKGYPIDDGQPQPGAASGYGQYGQLTTDDGGARLVCHECGRAYRQLGIHVQAKHMPVREYRLRHGLALSRPLAAEDLRQRAAEIATPERLAAHRDPDRARRAADPAMQRRGQHVAGRWHPPNTPNEPHPP